jgi:hypothetical protein
MIDFTLKAKIIERFGYQGACAKAFRLSESRLSRVINGISNPNEKERALFRQYLGIDVERGDSKSKPEHAA